MRWPWRRRQETDQALPAGLALVKALVAETHTKAKVADERIDRYVEERRGRSTA